MAVIGGLPFLHQALLAAGYPELYVIVADGDKVTATNCVRQPFSESGIGMYKSVVLVNRLNLFWGLTWHASTEYVNAKTQGKADIIISCVDARLPRGSRLQSHRSLKNVSTGWISATPLMAGNLCSDNRKTTAIAKHLAGFPQLRNCFPRLSTPLLDSADDLPCLQCRRGASTARALHQSNPRLSLSLAMLARLFRYGELTHHGGFVSLANGRMAPLAHTNRLVSSELLKRAA